MEFSRPYNPNWVWIKHTGTKLNFSSAASAIFLNFQILVQENRSQSHTICTIMINIFKNIMPYFVIFHFPWFLINNEDLSWKLNAATKLQVIFDFQLMSNLSTENQNIWPGTRHRYDVFIKSPINPNYYHSFPRNQRMEWMVF